MPLKMQKIINISFLKCSNFLLWAASAISPRRTGSNLQRLPILSLAKNCYVTSVPWRASGQTLKSSSALVVVWRWGFKSNVKRFLCWNRLVLDLWENSDPAIDGNSLGGVTYEKIMWTMSVLEKPRNSERVCSRCGVCSMQVHNL